MERRRRLQILLATMGVVATAAGADGVARGTNAVRSRDQVSADIDSEFRFFAAWYATAGVMILNAARTPERVPQVARLSSAGLLLGAIGRALSIRSMGRPRLLYRILLTIEIALPALLFAWRSEPGS